MPGCPPRGRSPSGPVPVFALKGRLSWKGHKAAAKAEKVSYILERGSVGTPVLMCHGGKMPFNFDLSHRLFPVDFEPLGSSQLCHLLLPSTQGQLPQDVWRTSLAVEASGTCCVSGGSKRKDQLSWAEESNGARAGSGWRDQGKSPGACLRSPSSPWGAASRMAPNFRGHQNCPLPCYHLSP